VARLHKGWKEGWKRKQAIGVALSKLPILIAIQFTMFQDALHRCY
jgi:hypothetical protein